MINCNEIMNKKDLIKLQELTDKYIDYNQQTIDYIFDRYIDNIIEKNRTSLLESNIIIKFYTPLFLCA